MATSSGWNAPDLSRRAFLAATGSGLAAASLQQSAGAAQQASDVAEPGGSRTESQDIIKNPKVGEPVSGTAKARGGSPTVPDQPPKKLGVAIVGLGAFSVGQILPAFQESEHCRPAALVSGDRGKADAIARKYEIDPKNIYDYQSYNRLAENDAVDYVFIILPNALHAEFTIRAARAGKHVLCEKPMATTVEDCDRMIQACGEADRKLMIAYRVQYEPHNMTAIEWSREKKYGPLQFIVADTCIDVGGKNQWRLNKELAGGGSLFDIGIYALNATRYLTGENPESVNAMEYRNPKDDRFTEVEQSIVFQLRFPSGVLANCTSSYSQPAVNRIRVNCEKGWYELDPATSYTGLRLFHGTENEQTHLVLPQKSHFAAEMDHFAQCIKENRDPKTPGEHGRDDVRIMHAIYESARSGRTVKL
jgi:predicted dehydrogenase